MEHKENEMERNISFAERVISKVRNILDKYMEGFAGYDELKKFMDDDNNLYDSNGLPTEEYKKKIAEVEEYVKKTSIDSTISSMTSHDETDAEVIKGILEFVDRRKEVIRKYTDEENLYGEDFNAENFLNNMLDKYAENQEERKQRRHAAALQTGRTGTAGPGYRPHAMAQPRCRHSRKRAGRQCQRHRNRLQEQSRKKHHHHHPVREEQ